MNYKNYKKNTVLSDKWLFVIYINNLQNADPDFNRLH